MALHACDTHQFKVVKGRAGADTTCTYDVLECVRCGAWESNGIDHTRGIYIVSPEEALEKARNKQERKTAQMRMGRARGQYKPR